MPYQPPFTIATTISNLLEETVKAIGRLLERRNSE